jgi:hypothetical protein
MSITSGNIDAVTEDIVSVDDNVTNINANAEDNALVLGNVNVAADHATLDCHRAPDRIDHAAKFDKCAIACSLDDPAMMSSDHRVKQFATMSFKRL